MNKCIVNIILVLLIGFASCVKVIDTDEIPGDRQPVVFAFVTEHGAFARLFWSSRLFIKEYDTANIADAKISFYEEGQYKGLLEYVSNGYYANNKITTFVGKEYKILIDIPDYETIEATTIMPEKVPVNFSIENCNAYGDCTLNQSFTSPTDMTTYYSMTVEITSYLNGLENNSYYTLDFAPPMFTSLLHNKEVLFCDNMIDGIPYNCKVNMRRLLQKEDIETGEIINYDSTIITPHFKTVNYDYYKFYTDVVKQDEISGNTFSDTYYLHSNIVNGYGIFAAYCENTDTFRLYLEK